MGAEHNASAHPGCDPYSAAGLQRALHLPVGLALGDVAPFVTLLLPAGERELDLHPAVPEIEPRRHERQPALAHLSIERLELLAVEQQLPVAVRVVVRDVSLL